MGEKKWKKTYIINIDGMRADYFNATGHQGYLTPTLVDLAGQGVCFSHCMDILPAVTATNHTAILTSTNLSTHGIYGWFGYFKGLDFAHPRISHRHGRAQLQFYQHRHLQGLPTLFDIARSHDSSLITAFITGKSWVGELLADKDHDILIHRGNDSNPDYVTPPEGYILGGERHEGDSPMPPRFYIPETEVKIARPPKGTIGLPPKLLTLLGPRLPPSDKWVIDQTIQTICHHDPDLMYILLADVDTAGHFYGSFSDTNISKLCDFINPDAMKDQLYITDGEIHRFITFLQKRYDDEGRNRFETSRIVITSDHGMSSIKKFIHAVDIRKELTRTGIHIRANTKWRPFGYNDRGNYEWCFSEGTHTYIFCRENEQEKIMDVLSSMLNVNKKFIFDKKRQQENNMWKGDYEDVVWPMIMVFLEQNYMTPGYGDEPAAIVPNSPHISQLIARVLDIPTIPGTHGTPSEQHVPLIFISLSEDAIPRGKVIDEQISVLDIAPTITTLQWGIIPPTFEGKSLIPVREKEIIKRRKITV